MGYVYVSMAAFLFSAELFDWAPYIRYYHIFPFATLTGCTLYVPLQRPTTLIDTAGRGGLPVG